MQYVLRKNHLKEEQAYYALITNRVTYDFEQLMEEVTREGSILKDTETEAVMGELFKQLSRLMKRGIAFRSDYFSMVPTIRGTFDHEDDLFDPARHEVTANLYMGEQVAAALKQVIPTPGEEIIRNPQPKNLLDNNTERLNSTLSAGHIHELVGKRLRIADTEDLTQGVFLIRADNNTETRIAWLRENSTRKLVFKVPADLSPGEYFLEVRSNAGKSIATQRKGRLDYVLTQA